MTTESIREERVESSKLVGDHYRYVSYYMNAYHEYPKDKFIPMTKSFFESTHTKALISRANKQYNNEPEFFADGDMKIRCRYCSKTFKLNSVDYHERDCDKNSQ